MPRSHDLPADMTAIPRPVFVEAFRRIDLDTDYCRCETCIKVRTAIWSGASPLPIPRNERIYLNLFPAQVQDNFPDYTGPHPAIQWTADELNFLEGLSHRYFLSAINSIALDHIWAEPKHDFEISKEILERMNAWRAKLRFAPFTYATGNSSAYPQAARNGTVLVRTGRWATETEFVLTSNVMVWHEQQWDARYSEECDFCWNRTPTFYCMPAISGAGALVRVCCDCRGEQGNDDAWRWAEDSQTFLHPDWEGFEDEDGTWFRDEPHDSPYEGREGGPLFAYAMRVQSVLGHICLIKGAEVPLPDSKALLFGVELETDADRAKGDANAAARYLVESAKDFNKWAICKSDSTVSGPEIVTVPACLDSHRDLIPWADWCQSARDFGLKGHNGYNTAIHIHVNRAALSALTLGKMLVFLNNEDNREFLEAVAQRPANSWCKRKPKTLRDGCRESQDKYEVLNVAGKTAEFRLFKANLMHERVLKNLEFCESLVRWCRTTPAGKLSTLGYFGFLQDRASQYPFLHRFAADNKLERTIRTPDLGTARPLAFIPGETEACA